MKKTVFKKIKNPGPSKPSLGLDTISVYDNGAALYMSDELFMKANETGLTGIDLATAELLLRLPRSALVGLTCASMHISAYHTDSTDNACFDPSTSTRSLAHRSRRTGRNHVVGSPR